MIVGGAVRVFGYMQAFDPKLAFIEKAVGVIEAGAAVAQRLYLGAEQYHARIVFVFDEILVVRRSIADCRHLVLEQLQ